HPGADAPRQAGGADGRGALHEAGVTLFLDLGRHMVGERVCGGALDRRVLEAADAVELRLVEPLEQLAELLLRLPRESDDECAAQRQVRTLLAPRSDTPQYVLRVGR